MKIHASTYAQPPPGELAATASRLGPVRSSAARTARSLAAIAIGRGPEATPAAADPDRSEAPGNGAAASQRLSERQVQGLETRADQAMSRIGHQLKMRRDDATGRMVVQIIDVDLGDLVRQIPGDDELALAQQIDEMRGLLLFQEG